MQENIFKQISDSNDCVICKTLMDHMDQAVWLGDKEERTIYANERFCKIVGYNLEEIIGLESYLFWDKVSQDKVRNINLHERKNGQSSTYEINLITKDQRSIPIRITGTPLPNGGTIGIISNIQQEKYNEFFQNLVNKMNEGVWMGDANGTTRYVNPKFAKMAGSSIEQLIGRNAYSFFTPECAEKIRNIDLNERTNGISSSYEANFISDQGDEFPVWISGTPLSDGGTLAMITDLSGTKEQSEIVTILKTAIEYANDAIIVFDDQGHINFWNKGAKIIFGYKEDEIIGAELNHIFNEDDVNSMLDHSEVLYETELKATHQKGHPITISATLTPIEETPNMFLLIARDITNQNRIEEELSLRYQKLKDAYDRLGVIRRQSDYIFDLIKIGNNNHDKQSIADFIVSSLIMLTQADACILRTYNPEKDTLDLVSHFGVDNDWQGTASLKLAGSIAEKAFEQKAPIKIIDVMKEPRYQSKFLAQKHNFSSLLEIPLCYHGTPAGTLALYIRADKKLDIFENEFIEEYIKVVELIIGINFLERLAN